MITSKDLKWICKTRDRRIAAGKQSLILFMMIYLSKHIHNKFAPFHYDIAKDLESPEVTRLIVLAFRGSAKSTLCSLAYPLQQICYNQINYMIFGSFEETTASNYLGDIAYELQTNELLINDFGHLYIEPVKRYEYTKKKTVKEFVTNNDIRLKARGIGQPVRGAKHHDRRPDLMIFDDIETTKHINNMDIRDKLENWIDLECIPACDPIKNKVVISGNLLHRDAVMQRIVNRDNWTKYKIPIIEDGKPTWEARYVMTDKELQS